MSEARRQILDSVRRALKRDRLPAERQAALDTRLATPPLGPVPARGQLARKDKVDLFASMAEEAACTVTRLADAAAVPAAISDYLARENLPARLRLAPHPDLERLPWSDRPLLAISRGRTDGGDEVSLTAAFAGIAETGTLMLVSGPEGPTTLNFLPETHIVLLRAEQLVGALEEAWARLRQREGPGAMPRTVNLVTGPSRSADIEQKIQMGAHGPRRLHILLVDGEADA